MRCRGGEEGGAKCRAPLWAPDPPTHQPPWHPFKFPLVVDRCCCRDPRARRYILESIRPEIRQYFIESDSAGEPFDRHHRSLAYQRAKDTADTVPFGTRRNVYEANYEFAGQSLWPKDAAGQPEKSRVLIGGPSCKQPYSASLLNISAMSYGSLSDNAVSALSRAAKQGGFFHNTGEGGMSR